MNVIDLNKNNLLFECFANKYFTDEMPPCFTSQHFVMFMKNFQQNISPIMAKDPVSTYCTNLTIYKNTFTRRTISLPNPYSYYKVLSFMSDNWTKIIKFAKSSNSTSPIETIGNLSSYTFDESRQIRCSKATGYKYRLSIDISNFYNSIYTHSITWAIVGKEKAKEYMQNGSQGKNKDYELADTFDKLMRRCKGNETNGIMVGPFASRVFSEIILSGLDTILRDHYNYVRFVDDYAFYFRSEIEAENALSELYKVFDLFNLQINKEKIEIKKFPFEKYYDFKNKFNSVLKRDGIVELLRLALSLYDSGQKGALKYALKMVQSVSIDKNTDEIFSYLINIFLVNPSLAPYCVEVMRKNHIKNRNLSIIINNELKECLTSQKQQELLWLLYLAKMIGTDVDYCNIEKAIERGDDFSKLIAFDLVKNQKQQIRNFDEQSYSNLETRLSQEINQYSLTGEHWLLLYELYLNKYISGSLIQYEKLFKKKTPLHEFFRLMKKNKVDFYEK
ncbi:MAG: RNA-directed DNA polymerase [Corallococcus sp.]|nr:RNA-directed DNA polymerase [Corallococcus sp.]MCM1359320.1 RNA-directed DNA polymerase [Corallococcus sp.]MCM1394869.1 RNA-directed DNA polymerase [Corallococcus sp.]